MLSSPSSGAWDGAGQKPTLAFVPGLRTAGSWWETWEICACEDYLLVFSEFSFSFSRLLQQGAPMTTEYFTLQEICSFCFCFCPHRMFLSAPCKGTSNYRAIHLHPHNFRQILEKACRWHWRKTFWCFYLFSLKEEITISFLVNPLMVHSFVQWANKCLFSVYLVLVCVGHAFILSTNTPILPRRRFLMAHLNPHGTHLAPC